MQYICELERADMDEISIAPLRKNHCAALGHLWVREYEMAAGDCSCLPNCWRDARHVTRFIESRLGDDKGVVLLYGGEAAGYMTFDSFDFHGEWSAFIPVMAHAARADIRRLAYPLMYTEISRILVGKGCLPHYVTFFSRDHGLKDFLYGMGFGLYVVDAYQSVDAEIPPSSGEAEFVIGQASEKDADALFVLTSEFHYYYKTAPLFLVREKDTREDIVSLLTGENSAVFIARRGDTIIGFINTRVSGEKDPITLSHEKTGLIDPLGLYVRKEYRRTGAGKALLNTVFNWCGRRGLENVHVDFESANINAARFWPKYFMPLLLSVKRRLNSDSINCI